MSYQDSVEFIEQARRQVAELRNKQAENDEMLRKLDNAQGQLNGLAATATSADGSVTVVAGSGGLVQSVELTESAMKTDAQTLSGRINATLRSAITQATQDQLEIVRTQVGVDVNPAEVLGPQVKFAAFAEQGATPSASEDSDRAHTTTDEDEAFDDVLARSSSVSQAPPPAPVEDEPMSESDRFLRDLR